MTTIAGLPTVRRWGIMVQRELGERLFATPATKPYAAVSVLAQLACLSERARAVPRNAFRPRPNVESVFLTFVRRPRRATAAGRWTTRRATGKTARRWPVSCDMPSAARRKQLGTSLPGCGYPRDSVRDALTAAGHALGARPEELTPAAWVRFARALGALPPLARRRTRGAP